MYPQKPSWFQRLTYWSDRLLRSSFSIQIVVLILLSLAITTLGSLLAHGVLQMGDFPEEWWWTFLRFISPDHLGDDKGFWPRSLATILVFTGWIVFGLLISLLATAMHDRLLQLRQGVGHVIDHDHTIILGWGSTVYSILDQLYSSEADSKGPVVLLTTKDKEKMEADIAKYCLNRKSLKTIVRTGSMESVANLRRVNLAMAHEVIILEDKGDEAEDIPDSKVIKTILAIHQTLATAGSSSIQEPLTVIAAISNVRTRKILLSGLRKPGIREVCVLMVETADILGRLVTQCAIQPGLSLVYRDLLSYENDPSSQRVGLSCEIYCVNVEKAGIPRDTSFQDCHFNLGPAIPFGFYSSEKGTVLNPKWDSPLAQYKLVTGDFIVAVAHHQSEVRWSRRNLNFPKRFQDGKIKEARHILMVGKGRKAETVFRELPAYLPGGSVIYHGLDMAKPPETSHVSCIHLKANGIDDILEDKSPLCFTEIDTVILTDDRQDRDVHDTRILATMMAIQVKSVSAKRPPIVVAELQDPRNRELAEAVDVREVIIGTEMVSNYMVQLARDPKRAAVFQDLLDSDGMELYLRHAHSYAPRGAREVSFDDLALQALVRGEIALGFITSKEADKPGEVILSPREYGAKRPTRSYAHLVVVAES